MKNRDGLENSDVWATPDWLYRSLDAVFHFDFDPYPLSPLLDGHLIPWGSSNFVNPPYNRVDKPKAIDKGISEYLFGKTVVFLLPASMGTKHTHKLMGLCPSRKPFKDWQRESDENCMLFFEGRLAFKGHNTKGEYTETNKGKHDSMLVILTDHKLW